MTRKTLFRIEGSGVSRFRAWASALAGRKHFWDFQFLGASYDKFKQAQSCASTLCFTSGKAIAVRSGPDKGGDKRLAIQLQASKKCLWEDDAFTHEVYHPFGDELCWMPTRLQLADCLTQSMKPHNSYTAGYY